MSGSRAIISWSRLLGVAAALGAVVLWQQRGLDSLRIEREQLAATSAAAPVAIEAASVAALPPPVPPAPAPVERARDEFDRTAIHRLQSEIDELRERVAARERTLREFTAPRSTAERHKAPITEETLPYADWSDAGRATPVATIETALWAGAGGDLRAFDQLLVFDDDTAAAARTLFERLPAEIRADYERPERIIALLTAGDVPLTAARIHGTFELSLNQRLVIAQVMQPDQRPRLINFQTRADAEDGTWRIVVPRSAIDAYAARLAGKASNP